MTLRYALDTTIVSAAFRADPPSAYLRRLEANAHLCALPVPVWHELCYGRDRLPPSHRRTALERFLTQVVLVSYPLLPYDRPAAEWHASERARLEQAGRTPALLDGAIAAITHVNGLILVTDNTADFRSFRGLRIENWLRTRRASTSNKLPSD